MQIGDATSSKNVQNCDIWHNLMRCTTELDESRIDISNIGSIGRLLDSENKDSIRLFDINFDNGRLKIPSFEVVDRTDTVL
ncbi:hypothetical protein T459_14207 [Capsicum annuum]|uniref:Uncharacterized protein n=1 Tax=Capsicum annuum TaxID=4072 RepID=A0A2G2ZGT0_CAPAN|nr:hypothetical protein T459_14207 [Capsicum annuum]